MQYENVSLVLEPFEQRLMVNGLLEFKQNLTTQEKPTEDVENLILKVIDAPPSRNRRWGRDAR